MDYHRRTGLGFAAAETAYVVVPDVALVSSLALDHCIHLLKDLASSCALPFAVDQIGQDSLDVADLASLSDVSAAGVVEGKRETYFVLVDAASCLVAWVA